MLQLFYFVQACIQRGFH